MDITDSFSSHRIIGSGGYAVVYKGLLHRNGIVAVKRLSQTAVINEKNFRQEVQSLIGVKHENVVRFLGYCSETQENVIKLDGNVMFPEDRQRLLCFEFMPNGSLDKYINNDVSIGLDWKTSYRIIKGICQGLDYLHQQKIIHLDLKPENILLDHCWVPKIADFGISKRFAENQTRAITSNPRGTRGYMAPESLDGNFTLKSDIYSLGVIIIEMLTGCKGYPDIQNVLDHWKTRSLEKSQGDAWVEQIRLCVVIGRECIDPDPTKRPTIQRIIGRINEMDLIYGLTETHASLERHVSLVSSGIRKPLDVNPLELRFPWEPNKPTEECTVTLTNRTGRHVAVRITPAEGICWSPSLGTSFQPMEPHSTLALHIRMGKQSQGPPETGKLEVLMVLMASKEHLGKLLKSVEGLLDMEDKSDSILERVKSLGGQVHRELLMATTYNPACYQQQAVIHNDDQKFIPTSEFERVRSIDVHPMETWVLAGHDCGHVSIWNYQTQEMVMVFNIIEEDCEYGCGISRVQFIAEEQWFAAGDYGGWVHVCAYNIRDKHVAVVHKFQAHIDERISALARHPTKSLLMTSSTTDFSSIKLWDWGQGWVCTQEFDGLKGGVHILTFNPRETSTFVCASRSSKETEFKVWDIHCSDKKFSIFEEKSSCPSCSFYTNSYQHFMVTSGQRGRRSCAVIRNTQTGELVHQLAVYGWSIFDLACHPTLPILATTITDFREDIYQICLWDARTYR
ncbi:hypothetical protein C2845_PM11G18160 [Panicum miliaceum]|uniref:Protein kinase domain-containing protein n=1 Tax=Panicum miliaceum TaxID=4540 RepID=A0A3L6RR94_PANMI|nr:hypothetical protein C2845_PM11G18160 [Panicum miliaceum]